MRDSKKSGREPLGHPLVRMWVGKSFEIIIATLLIIVWSLAVGSRSEWRVTIMPWTAIMWIVIFMIFSGYIVTSIAAAYFLRIANDLAYIALFALAFCVHIAVFQYQVEFATEPLVVLTGIGLISVVAGNLVARRLSVSSLLS